MSDISLTFPSSIQCGAVSSQRQKYLWICLNVTRALRDAGSFRGRPQLWGQWWGAWALGDWMVITGAQIMDDWRLFLAAVGFQYQRGPRIGILIRGGVSNKGEPSVKYGVQLRHTTTAISTRIKKAAQTKEGSFSWTKSCPRPCNKRHGRKKGHKGRERVLGCKKRTRQEFCRDCWKINSDRTNCVDRVFKIPCFWRGIMDQQGWNAIYPASKPFTHTQTHIIIHINTCTHTQWHEVSRLCQVHHKKTQPKKNKTKKTTKLFPFIPRFQVLQPARKAH